MQTGTSLAFLYHVPCTNYADRHMVNIPLSCSMYPLRRQVHDRYFFIMLYALTMRNGTWSTFLYHVPHTNVLSKQVYDCYSFIMFSALTMQTGTWSIFLYHVPCTHYTDRYMVDIPLSCSMHSQCGMVHGRYSFIMFHALTMQTGTWSIFLYHVPCTHNAEWYMVDIPLSCSMHSLYRQVHGRYSFITFHALTMRNGTWSIFLYHVICTDYADRYDGLLLFLYALLSLHNDSSQRLRSQTQCFFYDRVSV